MTRRDIVQRAAINIKKSKLRTVLTALGIAVGATTISLALAAGEGGRGLINDMERSFSLGEYAQIYAYKTDPARSGGASSLAGSDEVTPAPYQEVVPDDNAEDEASDPTAASKLSDRDIAAITKLDGVSRVYPFFELELEYITRAGADKFQAPDVNVAGADMTYLYDQISPGKIMPVDSSGKVVLSSSYLKSLNFSDTEDMLGKQVEVFARSATGKLESLKLEISGVIDKDKVGNAMIISVDDAAKFASIQYGTPADKLDVYSVHVAIYAGADAQAVTDRINALDGVEAYNTEQDEESLVAAVNTMQWGLVGFGGIVLLASVFGIVNTQYISVLERTQQVGLMKALGASKRDVAKLFRYEAAVVGVLGGVIGVAIAYGLTFLNPLAAKALELKEGTELLIFTPLPNIILVITLAVIAILAGWLPSRRAAKLDPIEALRTE